MPDPNQYRAPDDLLAERVVLVTGASRGVGRAVAFACAKHGASVVLNAFVFGNHEQNCLASDEISRLIVVENAGPQRLRIVLFPKQLPVERIVGHDAIIALHE